MSYTTLDEIPFNIRLCYTEEDLVQWMAAYNNAYAQIEDGTLEVPEYCISKAMYARELAFDACKYLPSSRFVECSATVEVVDRQNEVADIESYLKASRDYIENGGIGIEQHSSKVISVVWKAYSGIDEETGRPAIFTCENYFRGKKLYDDAWAGVLNGALQEKSIGSRIDPKKTHTECNDDGCHTRIYADQWFELSSVYRGANPRTYILEMNEAIKSFGNAHIIDCNHSNDMCPVRQKYNAFKEDVSKFENISVHRLKDGTMYLIGSNPDRLKDTVSQHYPEMTMVNSEIPSFGNITFIVDRAKGEYTSMYVFNELMNQVENEREAIQSYVHSMELIDNIAELSDEDRENAKAILKEIISDEEKHIGTLQRFATIIDGAFSRNLVEGAREADEVIAEKSNNVNGDCPAGQHKHAGVVGCHDIMRSHGSSPNEDSNSTDPSTMPLEKLRNILILESEAISQYTHEEIEEFLQTAEGRQYLSFYVEYMRRSKASDKTESEKMDKEVEDTILKEDVSPDTEVEKECGKDIAMKEAIPEPQPSTEMPEDADVGSIPVETPSAPMPEAPEQSAIPDDGVTDLKSDTDLPTAISNIASSIVFLKSKMEVMCARLEGLEDMMKMQTETKESIADNIMADVSEPVEEVAAVSPVKEESDAESEKDETAESDEEAESEETPKEETEEDKPEEDKPEEDKPEADEPKEDEPKAESEEVTPKEEPTEEKKDEKKKSIDVSFDEIMMQSDALTRRKEGLRAKGVDLDTLTGNPASISASEMSVGTTGTSNVSLVNTPAPTPYTPVAESVKSSNVDFTQWMDDMQSMSSKQFSERIRGVVSK